MRQIKFRAWDSHQEVMLSFDELKVLDSEGTAYFDVLSGNYQDLTPMQFTGLFDKSGKEIYEGDIMEFLDENWLVIYFEQYASFMLQKGNDLANITTQEEKICNIYENPDLLK